MARPAGAKRLLRPIVFALSSFFYLGCLGADTDQAVPSEVSDSLAPAVPIQGDTSGAGLALAEPQAELSEVGLVDTDQPDPSQEIPGDTALSAMDDLADRVGRLEEENDSLRIALRTLLPLLSGQNRVDSVPEPPSGLQEELLSVDREQVRHWGLRTVFAFFILVLTGMVVRVSAWVLRSWRNEAPSGA